MKPVLVGDNGVTAPDWVKTKVAVFCSLACARVQVAAQGRAAVTKTVQG